MLNDPRKYYASHLTDKPLSFGIGQDTGLAELIVESGIGPPEGTGATMYLPVRILLTPEASRALLADLPKLACVLEQAAEGPTKPDFVQ